METAWRRWSRLKNRGASPSCRVAVFVDAPRNGVLRDRIDRIRLGLRRTRSSDRDATMAAAANGCTTCRAAAERVVCMLEAADLPCPAEAKLLASVPRQRII